MKITRLSSTDFLDIVLDVARISSSLNNTQKTTNGVDYDLKDFKMGRFGNIIQKIRNNLPSTEYTNYKHEDCANFNNGICIAAPRVFRSHLTNLPPKGPACIHFKSVRE